MPERHPALRIALVGAESTGKSQLALSMAEQLQTQGLRCVVVPEVLRGWCDRLGRTPEPHEQAGIALEQAAQVEAASAQADLVLADTTPLMTAVYSDMLFNDLSLYPAALAHQRQYQLTLLTGLDLPWVADGLQRDGPHVREPVDRLVRQALAQGGIAYKVVYGRGQERAVNALCALETAHTANPAIRAALTSMAAAWRDATVLNRPWQCEKCSDADCEHRLFSRLLTTPHTPGAPAA